MRSASWIHSQTTGKKQGCLLQDVNNRFTQRDIKHTTMIWHGCEEYKYTRRELGSGKGDWRQLQMMIRHTSGDNQVEIVLTVSNSKNKWKGCYTFLSLQEDQILSCLFLWVTEGYPKICSSLPKAWFALSAFNHRMKLCHPASQNRKHCFNSKQKNKHTQQQGRRWFNLGHKVCVWRPATA